MLDLNTPLLSHWYPASFGYKYPYLSVSRNSTILETIENRSISFRELSCYKDEHPRHRYLSAGRCGKLIAFVHFQLVPLNISVKIKARFADCCTWHRSRHHSRKVHGVFDAWYNAVRRRTSHFGRWSILLSFSRAKESSRLPIIKISFHIYSI